MDLTGDVDPVCTRHQLHNPGGRMLKGQWAYPSLFIILLLIAALLLVVAHH